LCGDTLGGILVQVMVLNYLLEMFMKNLKEKRSK